MDRLFRPDSVAVSVSANAVAQAALRGIGLVRNVVLAWLLDRAQFGLFGLAMLVLNLLLPLCSLGLYEGIARYTPVFELDGTASRFARRAVTAALALAGGAALVLLLLAGWVGPAIFAGAEAVSESDVSLDATAAATLMRASTLCALTLALYHVMIAFLRGLRMFRVIAVAELVTAVVFTALVIAVAAAGWGQATLMIWSYAAANVASVAVLAPALRRAMRRLSEGANAGSDATHDARKAGESPGMWTVVRFSVWSAGTAAAWNAMLLVPAWYLLRAVDRETAGYFFGVRLIPYMIQYAAVLLFSVVYAHATRAWEHHGRDVAAPLVDFHTRVSLIALLAGTTVLSLARPLLVRIFPGDFAVGAVAYDPLLAVFLFAAVAGLMSVRLNLVEASHRVCVGWLIGLIVNLSAIILLLGLPGSPRVTSAEPLLTGVAWAGVAGVAAAGAAMVVLVRPFGLSPGIRTWILIVAALSPGFGRVTAVAVTILVVGLALAGRVVINPDERARILGPFRRLVVRRASNPAGGE